METISPHALSFTTVRSPDYGAFLGFVDAAFGRPAGRSLLKDFPTALGRSNLGHLYMGHLSGEPVCASAALVRDWHTSAGLVRVACLGAFATPGPLRGRGYSAALQQWMLQSLASEGVDWAVLWAERPEIYRGRGFREIGCERHARLESGRWPSPAPGERIRRARPDDSPTLLELYRRHPLRVERSESDLRAHLQPGIARVQVLERDGRVVAYAAVGKGEDFPGYVHDYAGEVVDVHLLWGEAQAHGAQHVLVPEGAERYLEGAAEGLPRRSQAAAMGRSLRNGQGPVPLEGTRWAAWGFDSA